MQGIGTVAIDGRRFQEFLRSRKDLAVGLHSWVNFVVITYIYIYIIDVASAFRGGWWSNALAWLSPRASLPSLRSQFEGLEEAM